MGAGSQPLVGRSLGLNLAVGRSSGFLRGRKRGRASILGPWRPLGTSHIPLKSDRGLGTPLGHNMVLWYLLGRLPCLGKRGGSCGYPCLVFPALLPILPGPDSGSAGYLSGVWFLTSHLWGLRPLCCCTVLGRGGFFQQQSLFQGPS